ncbi:MAG: hypothetical protein JSS96_02525 [Bacteroidetes bacterium]|nr:hypothetical protein [Bacteroidota bacterium]
MKKLLLIFNGNTFSESTFDFISKQYPLKSALLTAVFMSPVDYSIVWGYPLPLGGYDTEIENADIIAENITRFEALCSENEIEYKVHKESNDSFADVLKKETRFADMLIISGSLFYNEADGDEPGYYMRHALHDAECAVTILPDHYEYPVNNILTYDGSADAIYAIKQFAYLFPEWCSRKTYLVYANPQNKEIPDKILIEELARRHFPYLSIDTLEFDPDKYFNTWLTDKENAIIVTGAYERSYFSESVKKSFIAETIQEHRFPVFIAHK